MECILKHLISIAIMILACNLGRKIAKINKLKLLDDYCIGFLIGAFSVILCTSITVSILI